MRTATRAILGIICVLGAVTTIPIEPIAAAPGDQTTIQIGIGSVENFTTVDGTTIVVDPDPDPFPCDATVVDDNTAGQSFRVSVSTDCFSGIDPASDPNESKFLLLDSIPTTGFSSIGLSTRSLWSLSAPKWTA